MPKIRRTPVKKTAASKRVSRKFKKTEGVLHGALKRITRNIGGLTRRKVARLRAAGKIK